MNIETHTLAKVTAVVRFTDADQPTVQAYHGGKPIAVASLTAAADLPLERVTQVRVSGHGVYRKADGTPGAAPARFKFLRLSDVPSDLADALLAALRAEAAKVAVRA